MNRTDLAASWNSLLDFAFPPLCFGCGEYFDEGGPVCRRCLGAVRALPHQFCLGCRVPLEPTPVCGCRPRIPLLVWGEYTAPLADMVIQFKFRGMRRLAGLFADHLITLHRERLESLGDHALLPVPLHPDRQAERGYNQAERIATALVALLPGFRVIDDVAERPRKRRPQSRLPHQRRADNIEGVFSVRSPDDGETSGLVVVDDVVTTGSTLREFCRTLDRAGWKVHAAVAVALAEEGSVDDRF